MFGMSLGRMGAVARAIRSMFSPSDLFTTGVNGAWYDPSDITTLYRDAAGTTPVTAVEQPVGLMLDKSKGLVLGPELVTNGDFSNGTTGWTIGAGWAVSAGACVGTNAASGSNVIVTNNIATVVGKWYEASWTVSSYSTGTLQLLVFNGSGNYSGSQNVIATGTYKFRFLATSTTAKIYFSPTTATAFNGVVDDVSLKELPGNHAFNSSGNSANFPVLSARYNLLTKSEQFDDGVWALYGGAGKYGSSVLTATFPSSAVAEIYYVITTTYPVKFSVQARSSTGKAFRLKLQYAGSNAYSSDFITTSDWQTFTFTGINPNNSNISIANDSAGTAGSIEVRYPSLTVANDAIGQPAYQRVNTSTDYDTVGFKPYLRFNGTNQWLQTNSIDFSYTDKMFVSAGVRKLSDAAFGDILELSATDLGNNGMFALFGPVTANGFVFRSKGTNMSAAQDLNNSSPITRVLSGIGDIAGDKAILRVNGAQTVIDTTDQGTGNYGNYPLYIGARAGSSLWFNGRLYSLIVAGKLANAAEITSTETYLNTKTGAF